MRVLFIQLRRLGDVLMITPAIRAFKTRYPEAELHVLTEPPADQLLRHNPYIDRVIPYNPQFDRFRDLIREVRGNRYDTVIDFFGNPRSAWLTLFSGSRTRIGFDYRLRRYAYNRRLRLADIHRVYSAGIKLHLLEFLDIHDDDAALEIHLLDEERARAATWLAASGLTRKQYCILSPVSRRPYKRWPVEKFAAISVWLSERNIRPLIIFGPNEYREASRVNELSGGTAVLAEEGFSLRETAALMGSARFYFGNDNVHKHMARAMGLPTFTIFGPVGATSWTDPLFPNQHYLESFPKCRKKCDIDKCRDYRCISDISVDSVVKHLEIFFNFLGPEIPAAEPAITVPAAEPASITTTLPPPRPAVFLDRDGTINPDPGFINRAEDFELYPDTAATIKALNQDNIPVIVVTNQSGIGRGHITEEALHQIHEKMNRLLAEQGARVDAIYYSPYYEEAADEKYRQNPDHRKPATGMLQLAAKEHNLDLGRSFMVGDRLSDIDLARNAGCRSILVLTGSGSKTSETLRQAGVTPYFTADNLAAAGGLILDNLKRSTIH